MVCQSSLPTHRFIDLEPIQCEYTDGKSLLDCDQERYKHEEQLGKNLEAIYELNQEKQSKE